MRSRALRLLAILGAAVFAVTCFIPAPADANGYRSRSSRDRDYYPERSRPRDYYPERRRSEDDYYPERRRKKARAFASEDYRPAVRRSRERPVVVVVRPRREVVVYYTPRRSCCGPQSGQGWKWHGWRLEGYRGYRAGPAPVFYHEGRPYYGGSPAAPSTHNNWEGGFQSEVYWKMQTRNQP
jgi:hypothetical protein